jgi:hypothetical protein
VLPNLSSSRIRSVGGTDNATGPAVGVVDRPLEAVRQGLRSDMIGLDAGNGMTSRRQEGRASRKVKVQGPFGKPRKNHLGLRRDRIASRRGVI